MRSLNFYTSKPFFAGGRIEFRKGLPPPDCFPDDYFKLMSKEVFTYETDKYILKICKDGLFNFYIRDFNKFDSIDEKRNDFLEIKIQDEWSVYLNYLNCIYLLFISAALQKRYPAGYFEGFIITNKDVCLEGTFHFRSRRILRSLSPQEMTEIFHAQALSKEVFDKLNEELYKACDDYQNIEILSRVNAGVERYKIYHFDVSLVLSWFIIESYLNKRWEEFLNSKNEVFDEGKRINSERMDKFKGRDYPISNVLNVLELSDEISFSLFKRMDEIRDWRNKIIHREKDFRCEPDHCQKAFDVVREIFEKETGINLRLDLSYGLQE